MRPRWLRQHPSRSRRRSRALPRSDRPSESRTAGGPGSGAPFAGRREVRDLPRQTRRGESMRFLTRVLGAAAVLGVPGTALAVSAALSIPANEAYLAANAHKPGVQVMRDGLQYRVIKPGFGQSPKD